MKNNTAFVIIMVLVLVGIDLLSKYFFFDQGLLSHLSWIQPAMNYGISLSFSLSYRIVIPLSIAALWLFYRLYRRGELSSMVSILLFAGTIGNLYDRIVYDGVRDFLVMPGMFIYNIADVYLFVAILFALYGMSFSIKQKKEKKWD